MDTNISYSFDIVFLVLTLFAGLIFLLISIISKKDRVAFLGISMFSFLAAARIWSDYVYFRISVNGHRYEGALFLVLGVVASIMIIVGGFPILRRKLGTLIENKHINSAYEENPAGIKRVNLGKDKDGNPIIGCYVTTGHKAKDSSDR